MSNSVWPHRWQPTRLPCPWDSPGKNTGVGCHFLLQCMQVKSESEVAQSCPTLSDPMDCSLPGSSVHGIFQARVWSGLPLPSPFVIRKRQIKRITIQFSTVQSRSYVWLFVTPWTAACQASMSITNTWSWLKLMSIELVMPSNHLVLCHPPLLLVEDPRVYSWLDYSSF